MKKKKEKVCPKCGTKLGLTPKSMCLTSEDRRENYCRNCMLLIKNIPELGDD